MRDNESTMGAQNEEKPKKMTRAEFMIAFDEMNAILQQNIAQAQENNRQIQAKSKELDERIAATHQRLLNL